MEFGAAIAVSLKVLADWRVIAIAVGTLLLWAALRYVGTVYHKRIPTRPRASAPGPAREPAARGAPQRSRGSAASGEGMVE